MSMSIELIFENGVFRPVTPVNLPEATRVFAELDLPSDEEREEDLRAIERGLAEADAGLLEPLEDVDVRLRHQFGLPPRT